MAYQVEGLPHGWRREEVVRQSGLSAGKTDVFYLTPDGKKIRSKPQLARLLGESFDLSAFDFRTGRSSFTAARKTKRHKGASYDFARGVRHDASLVLPNRQTASIFKQPVTVVRNQPEQKPKQELKHGAQEPPRQVFWEKRLQGLKACDANQEQLLTMELPRGLTPVGPDPTPQTTLMSVSAHLHNATGAVTGQEGGRGSLMKDPGTLLDPTQPHMAQLAVTQEDVARQEQKVAASRHKLKELIKLVNSKGCPM